MATPPTTPIFHATTAHAVLTQPPLLSLIASFQRGVPSIAKPLLLRFIGDGLVYCTNTRVTLPGDDERVRLPYWYKTLPLYPRIVTPLCKSVRPHSLWLDHVLPQAIAKYEGAQSHRVLETWLRTSALLDRDEKPTRVCRQMVHRVSEAAASFGRVDLLQWLYANHKKDSFTFVQQRRLVALAVRNGHDTVLSWIEELFGIAPMVGVSGTTVWHAASHGHVEPLRWLQDRGLAQPPTYAIRAAINRNHLELLRYLILLRSMSAVRHGFQLTDGELVDLALVRGHRRIIECMYELKPGHISTLSALQVIRRGHMDAGAFLLERTVGTHRIQQDNWREWLGRLDVLRLIASIPNSESFGCSVILYTRFTSVPMDAVGVLLTMSSADDIVKTLVWTALYKREVAEFILANASASLPSDAAQFAYRIMDEAAHDDEQAKPSYYSSIMETKSSLNFQRRLWQAEAREIRAIVLYFIWQEPDGDELPAALRYDASRAPPTGVFMDRAFADLCVDLCTTPKSRARLQSHIMDRQIAT